MKALNFLIIFVIGLGVVIFSLENVASTQIHFFGHDVTLPLSVLLLLASGLGAFWAWAYSLWVKAEQELAHLPNQTMLEAREKRIRELQEERQQYQERAN
jgi:lipopolysaccharide assembly protein A